VKKPIFTGAGVAIVTPFEGKDLKINFPLFEEIIENQIQNGTDAIVVCGTTGEKSTLVYDEHVEAIRTAVRVTNGRIPVIAGTGSNDTVHAVKLSNDAEQCGVDGLLMVTPYYNKATPEGLYAHYSAIAAAVHIPVILYNVPSRTGVDIPVSIYRRLAEISNIAGVKEASTDIGKIVSIKGETVLIETSNERNKIRILRTAVRNVDVHAEDAE
jgi:4-hydroxy-tetrahydrodipicolinate synthase